MPLTRETLKELAKKRLILSKNNNKAYLRVLIERISGMIEKALESESPAKMKLKFDQRQLQEQTSKNYVYDGTNSEMDSAVFNAIDDYCRELHLDLSSDEDYSDSDNLNFVIKFDDVDSIFSLSESKSDNVPKSLEPEPHNMTMRSNNSIFASSSSSSSSEEE